MYILQLFEAEDEVRPIDARRLRSGVIRVGRDSAVDWTIVDPECELSRTHLELEADEDGLRLRALGANGVYDHLTGERYPDTVCVPVTLPATLRLGRYRLKAQLDLQHLEDQDPCRTMIQTQPLGSSLDVPQDWSDAAVPHAKRGCSLLDAFCEGAGLDISLLAHEDPAEILHRAGAVYRQMVLGVGDLMAERDRARGRYRMTRTTINGGQNNPFKWAPSQRLAIDLLLGGAHNFLSGPAALQASFRDIKRHLLATFAGLQGSLRTAISTFEPDAISKASARNSSLLKSRSQAQIEEVALRHADLTRQIDGGESGSLDRAFVAAYDTVDSDVGGTA